MPEFSHKEVVWVYPGVIESCIYFSLFFNKFSVFSAMQNTSLILIPFSLLASDPYAPPREYKDWLMKMSGKSDGGVYALMYK